MITLKELSTEELDSVVGGGIAGEIRSALGTAAGTVVKLAVRAVSFLESGSESSHVSLPPSGQHIVPL